jgi:superfamily II DNA helicase RecQ
MTTIYAGREVGEGIIDQLCQNKYVFKDHWDRQQLFCEIGKKSDLFLSLARCGSHSFHEGELDSVVAEYV